MEEKTQQNEKQKKYEAPECPLCEQTMEAANDIRDQAGKPIWFCCKTENCSLEGMCFKPQQIQDGEWRKSHLFFKEGLLAK